jgi:broad specificity phosphatase PhoE
MKRLYMVRHGKAAASFAEALDPGLDEGTFEPTLVFTHYVVINVAMGHALGDDRVRVFAPDHASVTVFDVAGAALRVVERGSEGTTRVL